MIDDIVRQYLELFPADRASLSLFLEQLVASEAMDDRRNFHGHITAAALVLSPDKSEILLVHHKIFNTWLQPGGHYDPEDADPLAAAQREVVEETAVHLEKYLPLDASRPLIPVSINTHPIPHNQKKHEPPHFHHDFKYVFVAKDRQLTHQPEEVNEARWFKLDDPEPQVAFLKHIIERLS